MISSGQIKKIENVTCEDISNSYNLLVSHPSSSLVANLEQIDL